MLNQVFCRSYICLLSGVDRISQIDVFLEKDIHPLAFK